MHYRREMRHKLMLIVAFSVYCQLGCTSQLRVPSKEDMTHAWTHSGDRLLSLREQGIQAIPENIFAEFENITVSFTQTHRARSQSMNKYFRYFKYVMDCVKWKKNTPRISHWLNKRISFDSIQHWCVHLQPVQNAEMGCTATLTRQSFPW